MEDGSIVVDLPNLGAQHVIIITVLCFHYQGIFGRGLNATVSDFFLSLRKPTPMRMFTLLTTLLLLALHTQAGSHQGSSEEAPDQEQLVKEDQDISTSFGMDKCSTLQDAGERPHHA